MPSNPDNTRSRPVFKTAALDDQEKFQPLPAPNGQYHFHLSIKSVLPDLSDKKMVFHAVGDTGGLVQPLYKHRIAEEMIKQCAEAPSAEDRPRFFFHLGDVVYNYGQAEEYYPQFFEPYRHYPLPIFAIPGNHDADIDPFDTRKRESLEAYVQVFCNTENKAIPFAGDTGRLSNTQPNVYWTMKAPLANIIALYSNVPRFGTITPEQREWFVEELKAAKAEHKALIVCLHHAAYSADTNHGSSLNMQLFLQSAFDEAGVLPDIVMSGHVHNYQRFTKMYPDGRTVPFVIAGAGGYADLHRIAQPGDPACPDQSPQLDNVRLENYCDHTHGFLKITLEMIKGKIVLNGEYFILSPKVNNTEGALLFDCFMVNIGE